MENGTGLHQPLILGMGNPILDMSAEVPDSFLEEFGLKKGDSILAEPRHAKYYERLQNDPKVKYVPGGATLNTIRTCQGILQQKNIAAFTGCIGEDSRGQQMEKLVASEGVCGLFAKRAHHTGVCGASISPCGERTMVTDLQSASKYNAEDFAKLRQIAAGTRIIYSAGFFISVCPGLMEECSDMCCRGDQLYCLNLASPFFVATFKDQFVKLLPNVDYLFSNDSEFLELAKVLDLGTTSMEEIAAKVAQLPKANSRPRVVVITQGCEPTIVASSWEGHGAKVSKFPVNPLKTELIADTIGAGDAFVGGFLAGLVRGKCLDMCVHAGCLAAKHIITQSGCTFNFDSDPEIQRLRKDLIS